ncbi:polysaccharide biosynthesis protein [Azospirillum halopraeferens]|uniref:polysaccharide biosynthesis protein n=1 Tax=Azospirillum halopraeferens TaxID=34010 RepID=UPI000428AC45|nr:polysaccharide biosynthesis protein [Azospirillum halopraeferens]
MGLTGKSVLITGGTGSLGKTLIDRILRGGAGEPRKVVVFSRDEAKQHEMRLRYLTARSSDELPVVRAARDLLQFRIGDVRDLHSVAGALRDIDVVFNAAALKQVPSCEYFPSEAVATNIGGAENIIRAIRDLGRPVETVVAVSTDKAVKPVNVMGMTKSMQERLFIAANLGCPGTRFVVVRYGNVLASRGSVIPLFHEQIRNGQPVSITSTEMTRFLLSLDDAVDVIFAALAEAGPGETYVPKVASARVVDIAEQLIGDRAIPMEVIGIRPGEKLHEILVSEEEGMRAYHHRNGYIVIQPGLPELRPDGLPAAPLCGEYSSADELMTPTQVRDLLRRRDLLIEKAPQLEAELLR